MIEKEQALGLLRKALGKPEADFRGDQWEAINRLVNKRERILLVQRTGWGKSAVYFLSTRILRDQDQGPTLIVSPLLALMRNQIEMAECFGTKVVSINSTNEKDWPGMHDAIERDEVDALLVSPERLANDKFMKKVLSLISAKIGLLVVDEAHCISDWGHDFRPDYRRLGKVLKTMPENVPILGTTATANHRVVCDIEEQLGDIKTLRGMLMRETLALQNFPRWTQSKRLAWLAENVGNLPGTGIIYALTKRDANQVAEWLNQNGIKAKAYYSDVVDKQFEDSNACRQHRERLLLKNEIKALVATTALGMGYDKPDLGFVIHYQAPGSVIAYYQQVGRAGRGIDRAFGILLSGSEDGDIHEYFRRSAFPKEQQVTEILDALEGTNGLSVREMEGSVNLKRTQIAKVLKILSVEDPAPVILVDGKWRRSPRSYRMDHERISRLTGQREVEWQEIQSYLNETGCLMKFLARALDDVDPGPCGRCASCRGTDIVASSVKLETILAAGRFLKQAEAPLQCKKQVAGGAFKAYGFKGNLPQDERAEVGRILSRWGDAGWGQHVADDKHRGRFRDELVDAVAEMITERWNPDPVPQWVTCVPSKTRPTLVPDYAKRLAAKLQLSYHPVVEKVRDNEAQKLQQNRFYQCSNLDGVFEVKGEVLAEPVLLVDDVVDSAWTLTVVAALLRRAGCKKVWPLALATSSTDS